MDLAHLSTLCSLPFTQFTISHSIGSVSIPTAVPLPPLDRFLSILTKHQAWAPVAPMLLPAKSRFVRVELCFRSFCQCLTQDLQNTRWNHLILEIHIKTSQCLLLHSSHTSSRTHMWSQMKRTNSNSPRSAWWTWHISAPMLCMAPLSLSSPFHLRFALSRSLLQYLSQLWLVPHHRHHRHQTPSLGPGITNLAVTQFQVCQGRVVLQSLLPMPHSKQRSAKYVVKIIQNSLIFTYKKSQRLLPHSSHTSSDTHISSGLQWNEKNKLKFTQICMMDLAHLSTNLQCSLPFTNFVNFTFDWLCLDPYCLNLPPSWPIPQHPHQTPSLSPGSTNVVASQTQVCQGRVVLQSFCQCLTQDVQNTRWNHLILEIHIKTSQCLLLHSSHTCSDDNICGLKWNEKNKLKFTQICMMAHLFHHFTFD